MKAKLGRYSIRPTSPGHYRSTHVFNPFQRFFGGGSSSRQTASCSVNRKAAAVINSLSRQILNLKGSEGRACEIRQ